MSCKLLLALCGAWLLTLILAACHGTLVIPFPRYIPYTSGLYAPNYLTASFSLENPLPRFGDTVVLSGRSLLATGDYDVWLGYAASGRLHNISWASPNELANFGLGRLAPLGGQASLSFDVRPRMGHDQYGQPFTLAASSTYFVIVHYSLTQSEDPTIWLADSDIWYATFSVQP